MFSSNYILFVIHIYCKGSTYKFTHSNMKSSLNDIGCYHVISPCITYYSTQSPIYRHYFLPDSYQNTIQESVCQAEIRGNALTRNGITINLIMIFWMLWRLCIIGRPNMSGADEKLQTVLEGYSG